VLSTTGQVLRATMSDAELAAALTSLRAHRARAVEHLAATDADIAAVEAEIERRARPALKRRARATVVTTGGGA
jgi:anthranilate phosphoribosyltransferase